MDDSAQRAAADRIRAEQQLAQVRSRWQHVHTLAEQLRQIRQANNFATQIRKAFEG